MKRLPVSCLALALVSLPALPVAAQTADPPGVPTVAPASEAPSITAEDIVQRWLTRSREVASLRQQVRGARFDVITAALWPNPSLQVNFLGTAAGTPPDGVTNYGVQVTQPLPIFGQVSARRQAAVAALSLAEVSVANTLWGLASDLSALMVERAFADARVTMAERNLGEVTRLQQIITRRVSAGANSQYDALRVQVGASTLNAALNDARVARDRAEARLSALLADPDVTTVPITREGLSAFRGPENLAALLDLAQRRRPDLELARRGVLVGTATAERWSRETRWTPSVSLGAYGTHDADSISVTAAVSFPLPVFDRNQGLMGRARSDAEGQRLLGEALGVRINREVTGAWTARANARAALTRFRAEGMAATAELLHRAEVTYEAGGASSSTFTIQDLFDSYRTMWDARTQELELQRSFAEAEADLERAVALVVP